MNRQAILDSLDAEIRNLTQAKVLIAQGGDPNDDIRGFVRPGNEPKRRGRPKGSTNAVKKTAAKRSPLSPEARQRIADAMKKRWAKVHKAAKSPTAKKAAKKTPAKSAA